MQKLFILCFLVISFLAEAEVKRLTLSEALEENTISLSAIATGNSYFGKGISLSIKNLTAEAIHITIDEGLVLHPEDKLYQPLLLAGRESLTISASKEKPISVQTFCGNADKSSPPQGLRFELSTKVNDTIVKLLKYLHTHRLLDVLGQNAIWTLTNHKPLSNVYDPDRDKTSKELIDFIAVLTGRPKPNHYTIQHFDTAASGPVYQPKTLKIIASFEEVLQSPKTLTLGVYNSEGEMIQEVFSNRTFGKGGHRFRIEFDAYNVQAGNYFVRLSEGSNVVQEKMVEVK